MDGLTNTTLLNGVTGNLNRVEIDRRALKDPYVDLKLDSVTTGKNNTINFSLAITADTVINTPLIVQVALIENSVSTSTSTGVFQNVLRKLLLGSDGLTLNNSMTIGQTNYVPAAGSNQEIAINVPISDPSKLSLVAFVEDKNTKEIYQSVIIPAPHKTGTLVTGIGDTNVVKGEASEIQIFPNPANRQFNFELPPNLESGYVWKIADQNGIFVMKGDFSDAAQQRKTVDVSSLSNGVYLVLIGTQGKVPIYKKLVVMNSN
jgi:hypothetical protein